MAETAAASPSSSSSSKSTSISSSPASRDFDVGFPLHCIVSSSDWLLAAGGGGEAKTGVANGLVVFKWEKRRLARILTHDTGTSTYHRLALHPSEPICAGVTLRGDCLVMSFGVGEGVKVRESKEKGAGVSSDVKLVAFAKQGDELATVDTTDKIRTLAFPSMRMRDTWAAQAGTSDLQLSPAGDFVFTLSDTVVAVWSRTGQALYKLDTPLAPSMVFRALGTTSDGRVAVSAMRKPVSGRGTARQAGASCVQLYDVARTDNRGRLSATGKPMRLATHHHTCMGVSANGAYVALGSEDGVVHVFRTDYASIASTSKVHEWIVTGACFDASCRVVASSSVAYAVKVQKIFPQSRSYWNLLLAALILVLLYYAFAAYVQPFVVRMLDLQ